MVLNYADPTANKADGGHRQPHSEPTRYPTRHWQTGVAAEQYSRTPTRSTAVRIRDHVCVRRPETLHQYTAAYDLYAAVDR